MFLFDQLSQQAESFRQELARRSLARFIKYTKPNYVFNWHHRLLCQTLERFAFGEIKRLIIEAPPQHGKSEITSRRLPAFILGHFPQKRIMAASYSAALASRMNRDVQRIMDSEAYHKLFPDVVIPAKGVDYGQAKAPTRNNTMFEIIGTEGSYRCAGVGGGFTGMSADFFLIDDPIKDARSAGSGSVLNSIWEWYGSVAETRLSPEAGVLLTMTRWHNDDLSGRLQRLARLDPDATQWHLVRLPAIAESSDDLPKHPGDKRELGEPLWIAKDDQAKLSKIKKTLGPRAFNAIYQQRPSAQEGNIVKRSQLKFYSRSPEHFDLVIQSWDCAFKETQTSSFVVGGVWGKKGSDFYLLDLVRARMDIVATMQAIAMLSARWPKALTKLIEDKANGPAVIQMLKGRIHGIIPHSPQGSKESRLSAVAPLFEAGNVYLPINQPWVKEYVEELVTFPNAPDNDQVDMTTQALLRLSSGLSNAFTKEFVPQGVSTISGPMIGGEQLW